MNYLSVGADAKTVKGEKRGYLTGILYLAPHTLAGGKTICPFSTPECRAVCLYTAGHGMLNMVQQARIRRTKEFLVDPKAFLGKLSEDIDRLMDQAFRKDMIPVVRLNGTSDIPWGQLGIMDAYPGIQFYGYTKRPVKAYGKIQPNDHITFSYSEARAAQAHSEEWYAQGFNTAVVFKGGLPAKFLGRRVVNGDETDLRFLDPKGVIVGLSVKGKARKAQAGSEHFIQQL